MVVLTPLILLPIPLIYTKTVSVLSNRPRLLAKCNYGCKVNDAICVS